MRNRELRTEFLYNFVKNADVSDVVTQLLYLDVLDKQNAKLICLNKELQKKLDYIMTYINNSVYLKNKIDPEQFLKELDYLDFNEDDFDD